MSDRVLRPRQPVPSTSSSPPRRPPRDGYTRSRRQSPHWRIAQTNWDLQEVVGMRETADGEQRFDLAWGYSYDVAGHNISPENWHLVEEFLPRRRAQQAARAVLPRAVVPLGDNNCSICQLDWDIEDDVRGMTPCGHLFHHVCIQQWLRNVSF